MTPTLKTLRVPLLIGAVTAALYLPRLGDAPIYVSPDEVFVALHAHSLATTGRDHGGHLLPLYVQYEYGVYDATGHSIVRTGWLPPVVYYATAIVLKILAFSEASIRFPAVLVGVIDVVLMYFIGRRLFKNEWLAILSAVVLALTPSHFIHSRFALDYLYPVPFVLAWLLALLTYVEKGADRTLFVSTFALGVGLYSYIAAALVMPLYLLMTWAVLWRARQPLRAYAVSAMGFLLPALLAAAWVVVHPTMLTDILSKYQMSGSGTTALQGLRGFLNYHRIADQLSRLWAFFDPRFLFFDGPAELMYSTREVGVFLLPVAPLLIVGIYALVRRSTTAAGLLILAGFFTAPLAATLVNVNDAIYRALELLPFAVLLAIYGVQELWVAESLKPSRRVLVALGLTAVGVAGVYGARIAMTQSRLPGAAVPLFSIGLVTIVLGLFADRLRVSQMIAVGLLAMMPVQFASFYADYFDNYRVRSSLIFSGNVRGSFEEALKEDQQSRAPAIYLAKITPYNKGGIYWEFYLIKHNRQDLAARTQDAGGFDVEKVLTLQPGSLVITNAGEGPTDRAIDRLVAAGQLSKTVIHEPDGTASYFVLRRTGG